MSPLYASWQHEKRSAYLYKLIAQHEPLANRQSLFLSLADEAEKQAALWAAELDKAGLSVILEYRPEFRVRVISYLIARFGPEKLKPILAAIKIRGLSVYSHRHEGGFHPTPASVEEVGASHKGGGNSGGLRAGVFGVNDGLVSIACLVMGVAGSASSHQIIILTGVAGLLAGAFSMAAGEYISMRSQREMFEYQIGLEREELALYPQEEASELALIYMARGMHEDEARALAQRMVADPEVGLDTLAREELGLNPDELGSPWWAAITSFFAFTVGGLIPLIPYLLGLKDQVLMISVLLTSVALFSVGATLSLFTGRSALWGGLRMLLIGGAAGVMTYCIGNLLGANLA